MELKVRHQKISDSLERVKKLYHREGINLDRVHEIRVRLECREAMLRSKMQLEPDWSPDYRCAWSMPNAKTGKPNCEKCSGKFGWGEPKCEEFVRV